MSVFYLLFHAAILAYALIGGVFLAFSDFIMRSLAHTPGDGGVEAMQVINREVFRWVFMTLFLGMAGVSLIIAVAGGMLVEGLPGLMIMLSGLVYVIGCFGVTVFCNVPMNQALAAMDASSDDARTYWVDTYLPRWTFWNTVRTVACTVSAGLLLTGLSAV